MNDPRVDDLLAASALRFFNDSLGNVSEKVGRHLRSLAGAAGAVVAAAIWPLNKKLIGKKIGLVICGANIDTQSYQRYLIRGDHTIRKALN